MTGAGDVEQHRSQRVAGQVVNLPRDPPALLGHGLLSQSLAGLPELLDQEALLPQGGAEREREHARGAPRRPAQAVVGEQRVGHDVWGGRRERQHGDSAQLRGEEP